MRRLAEWIMLAALGLALARACLLVADNRWYQTPALVAGTAGKPFVYRQLAPLIVAGLATLTGAPLMTAAAWLLQAACVGWLLALRALAGQVLSPRAAVLATVAAPLGILPFVVGLFVYDLPSLALFTAGLALLASGRWRLYLALFPVGLLCRETFGALLLVYVLHGWHALPRGRLALGAAYQLAAAVALKAMLAWRYAANGGGLAESHLIPHYSYLKAYPAGHIAALALLAGLVLLVLWRWPALPAFLRAAAVLLPVFFAAYVGLGYPGELRAVVEVYPVLVLLAAGSLATLASTQKAPARIARAI